MKVILNNLDGATNFRDALVELAAGAETLSVAVSYMQVGGWELFRKSTEGLSLPRMRIVCTDQLGITQPAAVKRAISENVQIRNFCGSVVYHPKVFLATGQHGQPTRFLLGSANLSTSAFSSSVEAGILGDERGSLRTLDRWFNNLFDRNSSVFTPELLNKMEEKWRLAAAARARYQLKVRGRLVAAAGTNPVPVAPDDLDTLEDLLVTIQLPIGLLNMDYAGNNIRNISKAREVIRSGTHDGKQCSELKLLGFMHDRELTALGRKANSARTNAAVARLWCDWLVRTSNEQLEEFNERLLVAKRVLSQFWRLRPEVREYFLANAESPTNRRTLQTIELLCNASQVVQELSLSEIETLSGLLQSERVPEYIRSEVRKYFINKGTRGWDTDDRRIIPLAWREANGSLAAASL